MFKSTSLLNISFPTQAIIISNMNQYEKSNLHIWDCKQQNFAKS